MKGEGDVISFDVFALSPQGYEVHFQIQGDKVYDDALRLLEKLDKDSFKVRGKNGHQQAPESPERAATSEHYCQGSMGWRTSAMRRTGGSGTAIKRAMGGARRNRRAGQSVERRPLGLRLWGRIFVRHRLIYTEVLVVQTTDRPQESVRPPTF